MSVWIAIQRLERAIAERPRGGMIAGMPKVRMFESDAQLAIKVIKAQAAEIERLKAALVEITQLESHRHPCCPTNLPKGIAREALRGEEG